MPRPIVFFDISIGQTPAGRIKMELFDDIVPKCVASYPSRLRSSRLGARAQADDGLAVHRTAENFRQFCTGEHRENSLPVGYKNAIFHRCAPSSLSSFLLVARTADPGRAQHTLAASSRTS